jgi:hypothetical protein
MSSGDIREINVVAKLEGIAGKDLVERDICVCSFVNWNEGVMTSVVIMTITAVLGVISSMEVVKIRYGNKGVQRDGSVLCLSL